MTERIVEMMDVAVYGGTLQQVPNADKIHEEIVRCNDCERAFEKDNGMYSCHGELVELWDYYNDCPNVTLVPADGFCFCGKRREE